MAVADVRVANIPKEPFYFQSDSFQPMYTTPQVQRHARSCRIVSVKTQVCQQCDVSVAVWAVAVLPSHKQRLCYFVD